MSSTIVASRSSRSDTGRSSDRLRSAIFLAAVLGGYAFLLIVDLFAHGAHATNCPFKLITGFACPGCGMGRATLALLHGDPARAWSYHMLAIPFNLFVLVCSGWLTVDLMRGTDGCTNFLRRRWPARITVLVLLAVAVSWTVNIARAI